MKLRYLFIITLIISPSLQAFSMGKKEPFVAAETTMQMSRGEQPCFSVQIPEASLETVEYHWERTIRHKTRSRMEREGVEYLVQETHLKAMGENPVNVWAIMMENENGLQLAAFFESDSVFVSEASTPVKAAAARALLADFAREVYTTTVEHQVKEQEKVLKGLERDLKHLEKDNDKLHREIAMAQSDIGQYQADLDQNRLKLYPASGRTVPVYNDKGEEIDRAPAPYTPRKVDPDLKKEVDKESRKIRKKIARAEARIRKSESKIPRNLAEQESKLREIEAQKQYIEQIESKLDIL